MSKKVLFFGDPGIDDAIALIYAHFNDDIDIVGIVAEYGNVSKEKATENIRYLLQRVGRTDIKIFGGAERPLTGETPYFYPEVHGVEGLGYVSPPGPPEAFENFFNVVDLIKQYQDEIIIVSTGRPTSLATLFILYKNLMTHIKSFYIMGGAFFFPGNVTPVSEANFHGDPVAADIVLRYAQNVYLYPLNVTHYAVVTPEMVNIINDAGKSDLIKPMMDYYYYNFYQEKYPALQGAPVHDLLTLMAVLGKDMFQYSESKVVVDQSEGATRGQSIGNFRPEDLLKEYDYPVHRIAFRFDYTQFYRELMTTLT
ncbi:nucleoside hydrolase [Tuberibacillus sp. Marseille-P3662]|uniref:nucleoside hydrolase n=1 Tax=Tuberibacillus sp. Marseille-P3662 TaxID=1965358 RepID=UPI000A1CCCF7|nr:nucleoside hydrolase [Tuberibacillus sp. Marseille-P3662]